MNKRLLNFLRVMVGILILGFLLYKLDIGSVYQTILKVNFFVILLVLFHFIATAYLNTVSLSILVNASKTKIKFCRLLKYYLLSNSMGNFSPARIGEFYMAYMLKKDKMPLGKGMMLTIVFRFLSLMIVAIISIFGLFLFFPKENALEISLIMVLAMAIFYFLVTSSKIKDIIKKFILKEKAAKFKGFSKTLNRLIKYKKASILLCLIVMLFRAFITAAIMYYMFKFFGIDVSIPIIMAITSIGILITLIPISISGLGVKESAIVFMFGSIGINPVIAGSIYLLVTFAYYIIGGLILLIFSKDILKNITSS